MSKKLIFLLLIGCCTMGCPKKAAESDTTSGLTSDSISRSISNQMVGDYGWNPTTVFPNLDLPEIYPDPLEELDGGIPSDAVRVNASNIGDGSIFSDPDKWFFVVEPGDYSHLGRFSLNASGTPDRRRVIMSVGKAPWDRREDQRARFDAFDVKGDGWVFYNLEFYGNSVKKRGFEMGNVSRIMVRDNNTFSHCMWRNAAAGIRVYGNYNTVQFCVFRDKPDVPGDTGGVAVYAQTGKESRGNRVIGNEFIGMGDGAGVPWNEGVSSGSTPATVIAFNHSWVPESLYRTRVVEGQTFVLACAEDGYDIKNGAITDDPADQCLFIGNVSRGHRVTDQSCGGSGSTGASWIFHRRARNWLIMGNLSYDDALGCYVKNYDRREDGKHRVENITIRNNVFANLAATYPGGVGGERENPDNGLAFRVLCPTCEVYQNIVVDAERDSFFKKSAVKAQFRDNLFVDVRNRSLQEGHRSANEIRWNNVQFKASPLVNPTETLTVRIPVEK